MLTVFDNYTHECSANGGGHSLKGDDVVRTLNTIVDQHGLPVTIKTDDGSEFLAR